MLEEKLQKIWTSELSLKKAWMKTNNRSIENNCWSKDEVGIPVYFVLEYTNKIIV